MRALAAIAFLACMGGWLPASKAFEIYPDPNFVTPWGINWWEATQARELLPPGHRDKAYLACHNNYKETLKDEHGHPMFGMNVVAFNRPVFFSMNTIAALDADVLYGPNGFVTTGKHKNLLILQTFEPLGSEGARSVWDPKVRLVLAPIEDYIVPVTQVSDAYGEVDGPNGTMCYDEPNPCMDGTDILADGIPPVALHTAGGEEIHILNAALLTVMPPVDSTASLLSLPEFMGKDSLVGFSHTYWINTSCSAEDDFVSDLPEEEYGIPWKLILQQDIPHCDCDADPQGTPGVCDIQTEGMVVESLSDATPVKILGPKGLQNL